MERSRIKGSTPFIIIILINNDGYGIDVLIATCFKEIHQNILIDNNNGGTQASDYACTNEWHRNRRGNYWSDRNSPDEDGDYVVDDRYYRDGTADNSNIFPLAVKTVTPIAKGGGNIVMEEGTTVQFKGYLSYDNIKRLNYTWVSTYNGREIELYGINPKFNFEINGVYEVNLTFTNEDGNRAEDFLVVTMKEKREYETIVTVILAGGIVVLIVLSVIHKRKMKGRGETPPVKGRSGEKSE